MAASRRRWFLVAAALVLSLVVAAGAAAWWFVRAYGPAITKDRIEAGLAAALDRPVRIERVGLRLWLGRLALEGVTVGTDDVRDAGTFGEAHRIELHAGISSLWRRELVLSRIQLSDVKVRYVATGTGGAMQPLALPERIAVGPLTVFVKAIALDKLDLDYQEPPTGRRVVIEGATITLRPVERALDIVGEAARIRIAAPGLDEVLDAVEASGRLAPDRLLVRSARARWWEAKVRLQGEVASPFATPELALDLDADLPLARLVPRPGAAPAVDGTARVRAAVRGAWPGLTVTGTATAPDVTVGGIRARRVAAEGRWHDGELTVNELTAQAFGGTVRGSLILHPDRLAQSRVRARLVEVSLAELEQATGRALGLAGRATLEGELLGDPRDLTTTRGWLRLEPSPVSFPGAIAGLGAATVSGEARVADRVLDVGQAVARWTTARVELRGPVTLEGPRALRASVWTDLRQSGRLLGWHPDLSGEATADTELQGRWPTPQVSGQVRVPALAVAGVRLERVAVGFSLRDNVARIEQARAVLGESEVIASGQLAWLEAGAGAATTAERLRLDLDVGSPSGRVEDVNRWLPEAWRGSGRFTLTGRLSGVVARWRGAGQIEAVALALRHPLERLKAQFSVDAQALEISTLTVRTLGVPVTGNGTWRWDGSGRLAADLGPARLAELPGLDPRLKLAGSVSGRASLISDAGRVSGAVDLVGSDVSAVGLALGAGTARLALRADAVEGRMDFPGARLTATAAGRLGDRESVALRARLEDADVTAVLQQAAPALANTVEGRATLDAELAVPLADPARAQGTVVINPLRLVVAGEPWQNRSPMLLRRTPGILHVESAEVAGHIGTLSATGAVHDGGRLDIQARGRIPLAVLASLRPEVREATGILTATVKIAGTTSTPEATGEGTISDGLILLRDYPEALRGVRAELRASPNAVRIVRASATVGGGSLNAGGEVRIAEGRVGDFRVAITARRVDLSQLEGLETAWDADLELVGFGPRALLRGEARLVRGLYARDISLLRLLLERRPAGGGPTGTGVHLDLRANLDDNIVVRTALARLQAGGALRIQGTSDTPIVFGSLTVREGQVVFRRHTFELTSASVRFTDPRRLDPELDVRGIARIRDYDVTMQVTGRSDDLKVSFVSSPPLPEEDVLSLVAFGATRAQMGRAGAGAFVGEAASFLAQDLLGIQPGQTGVNVYMDYAQGPETTDERRLRVEYQVFGPLRVAGEQDFRGGFGGDVLIRFRFR